MRPLSLLGVGLSVVVLDLSVNGLDVTADWIGWLVCLLACAGLPPHLAPGRLALTGALALLVAVVTWVPGAFVDVESLDTPLAWAISLPQVVFVLLLALAMSCAAQAGADDGARGWWRLVAGGCVVLLLLPPVVYGAGVTTVLLVGALLGLAAVVSAVVLCFRHAQRSWAQGDPTAPATV